MSSIKLKKFLQKFWFIVWKDDSFRGWILSILFIFVVIKFIFFPTLSFFTGTALPLAIVESCSMHHEKNLLSDYDSWLEENKEKYSQFNLENEDFENFDFKRGFTKGDILFITGAKPEKIKIGDIIIFNSGLGGNPVIHRVVKVNKENNEVSFSTLGDNNNGQLNFEENISSNKLVGKAVFRIIPYGGWIKLVFFEAVKPSSERGFC